MRTFLALLLSFLCSLASADTFRLRMNGGESYGTAFNITKRKLLTAAHCIENYARLEIEISPDKWVDCTPAGHHHDLDVALLKADTDLPNPYELDEDGLVKDKVECRGCPLGVPVKSLPAKIVQQWWMGSRMFLMEGEFDHGCSGGPVLKGRKVVGLMVALPAKFGPDGIVQEDKTKGLAIPTSAIRTWLRTL